MKSFLWISEDKLLEMVLFLNQVPKELFSYYYDLFSNLKNYPEKIFSKGTSFSLVLEEEYQSLLNIYFMYQKVVHLFCDLSSKQRLETSFRVFSCLVDCFSFSSCYDFYQRATPSTLKDDENCKDFSSLLELLSFSIQNHFSYEKYFYYVNSYEHIWYAQYISYQQKEYQSLLDEENLKQQTMSILEKDSSLIPFYDIKTLQNIRELLSERLDCSTSACNLYVDITRYLLTKRK